MKFLTLITGSKFPDALLLRLPILADQLGRICKRFRIEKTGPNLIMKRSWQMPFVGFVFNANGSPRRALVSTFLVDGTHFVFAVICLPIAADYRAGDSLIVNRQADLGRPVLISACDSGSVSGLAA